MKIFSSLQRKKEDKNEKSAMNVVMINTLKLASSSFNFERKNDREGISALAKSISQVGLLQPILVRKTAENRYRIVSGERRVKACRLAGLREIPCIVLGASERKCALFSVSENLQRKGLGIFEEAVSIKKMCDLYGMTAEDCGVFLGLSAEYVKERLSVLRMSAEEREICENMKISDEGIIALGRLSGCEERYEAMERLAKGVLAENEISSIGEIMEKEQRGLRKNSAVLGDTRLFFNTVNRAVEILNGAGGNAVLENIRTENETMLLITVKN